MTTRGNVLINKDAHMIYVCMYLYATGVTIKAIVGVGAAVIVGADIVPETVIAVKAIRFRACICMC